jgi:hypothetical protein
VGTLCVHVPTGTYVQYVPTGAFCAANKICMEWYVQFFLGDRSRGG